jgi:hypothetical protein
MIVAYWGDAAPCARRADWRVEDTVKPCPSAFHWRAATLGAAVAVLLSGGLAAAQLGDPRGPGQAVPAPPPMCTQTISCTYGERNYLPDGYRVQALNVCGANCTTQYWVSNISDGKSLLTLDPVRGGGIVAVGGGTPVNEHAAVRVILPSYGPSDPACCPSGYSDTTYTWDAANGTLVAGTPSTIPSGSFGGWDAMRETLQRDGFFPVFPNL